ncbi:hypothetical protein AB0H69_45695 [Streptomyces phaeochromogenes]|uniref:hypothetical protein n=1 Tax=Streptomyces phaeochromogenes TaxID=1923 RepID=UPI0033D92A95
MTEVAGGYVVLDGIRLALSWVPCQMRCGLVGQPVTTIALADAVLRDAARLLQAYEAGQWVPEPAERELAEGLALGQWSGSFLRAALRDIPPTVQSGRLIDVLAPACEVLDQADVDEHLARRLRVLIDALTPDV